jgi:hypothetical protein
MRDMSKEPLPWEDPEYPMVPYSNVVDNLPCPWPHECVQYTDAWLVIKTACTRDLDTVVTSFAESTLYNYYESCIMAAMFDEDILAIEDDKFVRRIRLNLECMFGHMHCITARSMKRPLTILSNNNGAFLESLLSPDQVEARLVFKQINLVKAMAKHVPSFTTVNMSFCNYRYDSVAQEEVNVWTTNDFSFSTLPSILHVTQVLEGPPAKAMRAERAVLKVSDDTQYLYLPSRTVCGRITELVLQNDVVLYTTPVRFKVEWGVSPLLFKTYGEYGDNDAGPALIEVTITVHFEPELLGAGTHVLFRDIQISEKAVVDLV